MVFQLLQWEGHGAGGVGTSCWSSGTHRVVGGVVLVLSLPQAVIGTGYNQYRQLPGGSSVRKALQENRSCTTQYRRRSVIMEHQHYNIPVQINNTHYVNNDEPTHVNEQGSIIIYIQWSIVCM